MQPARHRRVRSTDAGTGPAPPPSWPARLQAAEPPVPDIVCRRTQEELMVGGRVRVDFKEALAFASAIAGPGEGRISRSVPIVMGLLFR